LSSGLSIPPNRATSTGPQNRGTRWVADKAAARVAVLFAVHLVPLFVNNLTHKGGLLGGKGVVNAFDVMLHQVEMRYLVARVVAKGGGLVAQT
jgi:hypothetical protein